MPRESADDGLLAQFNLLSEVSTSRHLTVLDHAVATHIIKRYRRDFQNARASLRYLEQAAGALRPNIIASRDRLVRAGVLSVAREGAGTRPTEYTLNFCYKASGIASETASSGIDGNTSGGIEGDTSNQSSGIECDTESCLHVPADIAGLHVSKSVVAPLAADGLPAVAPRAPDGFDSIWRAYGKLGNKAKSRAAFDALTDPDVEHIAERAAAWAASAKPDARRMPLEKWLEQERYDEAERSPVPRAAKVETSTRRGVWTPALRITSVEESGSVFSDWWLTVTLDGDGGERRMRLQGYAAGQSGPAPDGDALACLFDAIGDHTGWVGQRVRLQLDGETIVGAERCRVARRVRAAACELVQRRGELVLCLTLAAADGAPEGRQEIVVESHRSGGAGSRPAATDAAVRGAWDGRHARGRVLLRRHPLPDRG